MTPSRVEFQMSELRHGSSEEPARCGTDGAVFEPFQWLAVTVVVVV